MRSILVIQCAPFLLYDKMDEKQIELYLIVNAPKYAEFKGIDSNFINDRESDIFKEYYNFAIDYLKEGGLIPKFQNGSAGVSAHDDKIDLRGSWRQQVFNPMTEHLIELLKKGLNGEEGGITMDQFNTYQSDHARIYNKAKNTDFYNTAYTEGNNSIRSLQERFHKHGFNELGIKPNWETRYKINSNKPTSKDSPEGQWTQDDLFSAITDDRRFGRDGDWTNDQDLETFRNRLKEIGYKYDLDKDGYYKLSRLNPQEGNPEEQNLGQNNQSGNLETGVPVYKGSLINNPLSKLKDGINLGNVLELAKYFDAARTNRRMHNMFQERYTWAPLDYRSKHRNIFGDLGALSQANNLASETQSKANTQARGTSDYRTASAISLEGANQANKIRQEANIKNNDLVRDTSEKALQLEFENIDKEQETANENRARQIAASNVRLNNDLEYENQKTMNRKALLDKFILDELTKRQDKRNFQSEMLTHQFNKAVELDSAVLTAQKNWEDKKDDTSWKEYVKAKRNAQLRLAPIYYEQLAKTRGIHFNYNDNPFVVSAKSGAKVNDDGPVKTRSKTLERYRKSMKDQMHYNDKKLDRLGRLTYLYVKRAQGKK